VDGTSRSGNPPKPFRDRGVVDVAIVSPTGAAKSVIGLWTEFDRSAACRRDLLQFVFRNEANPGALG
jgi:hypothetical protein